jgi:hypothetical protein
MKDSDRKLIRQWYQQIPTAEEKSVFEYVVGASRQEKLNYTAQMLGKDGMTADLIEAILDASVLTKEDRVMIFSGVARQLIFKVLTFLGF